MRKTFENFCKCSGLAILAMIVSVYSANAAVSAHPTAANKAASARVQNRVAAAPKNTTTTAPETEPEPAAPPAPEPEPAEQPIITENKTSMFQDVLSEIGASTEDKAADARAEMIRRQRALLAAADENPTGGTTNIGSANACDNGLRACMAEKCGDGFTKCANDTTVVWNTKMDACRTKTKCSGREYTLLAPEILSDRDMNVRLAHYDSVVKCGNRYNTCIFGECGTTLEKCLGKKDGDKAISKCESIAKECKSLDNGLASRAMSVFGDLRKIATARVTRDEKRLYELRNLMRQQCERFGANFDERTLDCIYTVNFFAGEDRTLMASKKLYPEQTFQCTPEWFGIDITTFKENAYRATRAQSSASSAALGAGLGMVAGLASSGAISRRMATNQAEKAVQEECESRGKGYKWDGTDCLAPDGTPVQPGDDQGDDGNNNNNGNNPNSGGNENQDGQNKGLSAPINITITDMQNNPIEGGQIGCDAGEEWYEYAEALFAVSNSKGLATLTLPNGLSEDTECIIRGDAYCGDSKQMTIKQLRTQTEPIKLDCSVPLNSDETGSLASNNINLSNNRSAISSNLNNDNLPPLDKAYTTRYYCQIYPKKCPAGTPISVSWGQWRVDFKDPDISLKGVSVCSIPTSQEYLKERWTKRGEIDHEKSLGKNCYCKLVLSDKTSEWILATDPAFTHVTFDDHTACTKDCPMICTAAFRLPVFRKKMYDTLTKR